MSDRRTVSSEHVAAGVAAALGLLVGILLRTRHMPAPLWATAGRPILVIGLGLLAAGGHQWANWLFSGLCVVLASWYVEASMQITLPTGMRVVALVAALALLGCAFVMYARAPRLRGGAPHAT